jgi:type I restriction enzyme S subunit
MSLKLLTINKIGIAISKEKRLDAAYYFVNAVFDELEKKSSCKVKTLDELRVRISSGSYVDTYINKQDGVPYLRVGNIKPFTIDEQDKSLVFVSSNVPEKIKVKENDLIMGRTQATVEKLGVASLIDKYIEGSVISQHVSKVTTDNNISPFYLIGFLNSKFYKAQTSLATHGDTRVELTHSQLRKVRVFIPNEEVVKNIEGKVKKIIETNRHSIYKINEAKRILKHDIDIISNNKNKYFSVSLSTIQDFGIWNSRSHLPKYVDIENEINSKFETVPLEKISSIEKGIEIGSDNYQTELFKEDGDYAFIRTSDITNYEVDIFPDYFVSRTIAESLNNTAEAGEIIFSKDGIIGETAIISKYDKVVIGSGFVKIKLNSDAFSYNITPEYLFTILLLDETGFFPAIRRTVIASTIPHLRVERLKKIRIPIVDKDSIDKITELIKEAYELKDEKKKLIIEIRKEIDSYYNII